MTYNSNKNDKFKKWREVKIVKNKHICKNLISHIWYGAFLVNIGHILESLSVFIIDFEQVNTTWER